MPTFVGDASYVHAKSGCYRCLRGDNLVDLDAQIEGEGALVLCVACIGDAAETAGLNLNAAAVAEITARHTEEAARFDPERIEALETALAQAEAARIDALRTVSTLQDALTRIGRERKAASK